MAYDPRYEETYPDISMAQGMGMPMDVPPLVSVPIPGIMMQQAYADDDFEFDDEYAFDEPEDMQAYHCLYYPEDCQAELPSGAVYQLPETNTTGNVPLEAGALSGLDPLSVFIDLLLVLLVCVGLHMAWEEISKAKKEDKEGKYV